MEPIEVRLARLEEGMVSVKGDTRYIRDNFDKFKNTYWTELLKLSGKVAGIATFVSLITGVVTVAVAHALWH
jgi:hypothetical protein